MAKKPETEAPIEAAPKDLVNHPDHYQALDDSGIECIKAMRAMLGIEGYVSYLKGTIHAYNWRLGRKGDAGLDAGKLAWYAAELNEVTKEYDLGAA